MVRESDKPHAPLGAEPPQEEPGCLPKAEVALGQVRLASDAGRARLEPLPRRIGQRWGATRAPLEVTVRMGRAGCSGPAFPSSPPRCYAKVSAFRGVCAVNKSLIPTRGANPQICGLEVLLTPLWCEYREVGQGRQLLWHPWSPARMRRNLARMLTALCRNGGPLKSPSAPASADDYLTDRTTDRGSPRETAEP